MRIWMTLFAGTLVLVLGARAGVAQEERRGPPGPANGFDGRDDRDAPRPGLGRSAGPGGHGFLAGFDKNDREDGKMDREESIRPRHKKPGRSGNDEGRRGDRKGGREAMIAAMKIRLAAHGWRGPAVRHAKFGPPPFGRSAGFGPGRDSLKYRSSMMGHHGHGFGRQMGPGMQWGGGPRFGRAGIAHHSRGPGRGPDMGRGIRDAFGPKCNWCPKAPGFGGPMMSQGGPGRGPEMGRGMRDAFGPNRDWRPKAPGFGGPMMLQGGPGRGPKMGQGMRDAFGPNRDWHAKAPGFGGPMMSHRGPGRSPDMGRDKTDREGRDFGRGADWGGPRMGQDFRRSDRPDSGHMGKAREPHNSRAKGDPRKIGPKEPDQAKQAAHEEGDTKEPEPKKSDERKSDN